MASEEQFQEIAHAEVRTAKALGAAAELRRKNKALAGYVADLEERVASLLEIKGRAPKPLKVRTRKGSRRTAAVPVVLVSDIHAAEIIRPGQLQDPSIEHNPAISASRCEQLWQHAVKLIKFEQARHEIQEVLLWLGGDFLVGEIHQDNIRSSNYTPTEEMYRNLRMLSGGIRYLLAQLDVPHILIQTSWGNHGRTTQRSMIANGSRYSYEQLMYWLLADEFRADSRIRMHVSESQLAVVDLGGYRIRFTHGDAVRYYGGIAGIQVPLRRMAGEWDKDYACDLTCLGHYHKLQDLGFAVVNGSVVGQTPFGQKIGAAGEPPAQVFFVVDLERKRKATVCPIYLD